MLSAGDFGSHPRLYERTAWERSEEDQGEWNRNLVLSSAPVSHSLASGLSLTQDKQTAGSAALICFPIDELLFDANHKKILKKSCDGEGQGTPRNIFCPCHIIPGWALLGSICLGVCPCHYQPYTSRAALAPLSSGPSNKCPTFSDRCERCCQIVSWCDASNLSDVITHTSLLPALALQANRDGHRQGSNYGAPMKNFSAHKRWQSSPGTSLWGGERQSSLQRSHWLCRKEKCTKSGKENWANNKFLKQCGKR